MLKILKDVEDLKHCWYRSLTPLSKKRQARKKKKQSHDTLNKYWYNYWITPHSFFRDVHFRDTLPNKIIKQEYSVINYDLSGSPGTHWTCYFIDPKYLFAEFFDSFGIPPGNEIVKYLKTLKKPIAYHSIAVQNLNDVNCGHLCVEYINKRFEGVDPQNFIYILFLNIIGRRIRKTTVRLSLKLLILCKC
jgi:hypothetical protein